MTPVQRILFTGVAIGVVGGLCGGCMVGAVNGPFWENVFLYTVLGLSAGLGVGGLIILADPELRGKRLNETVSTGKHITGQLGEVDWSGPLKSEGLRGSWVRLFLVWSLEQSPQTLGVWTTHPKDGAPLVTITDPDYIHDLQSRPQYREALRSFREKYPTLEEIRSGETWQPWFQFTGHGTTTGEYTQVEWFLGSYLTTFVVTDVDLTNRTVGVDVSIENVSSLQSGTRLPDTWQERGLPVSVLPSVPRGIFGPVEIELQLDKIDLGPIEFGPIDAGTLKLGPVGLGGTFWQRFVWKDRISY